MLVISTACSKGNIAQAQGKKLIESSERAMSATSDQDKMGEQSFQGGMNKYNDDYRYDSGTAAKTQTLIDTAKRRKSDNLGDYAEQITDRAGDRLEKAQKDIPRQVKSNLNTAAEYVDDKSDKLKRNLERVPGESKEVFDEAVENAKGAVEDRVVLPKK